MSRPKPAKAAPHRELPHRDSQDADDAEIQRSSGFRDSYDSDDSDEFRTFTSFQSVQDAARSVFSLKSNGDLMFRYARALKAFEATTGADISDELQDALNTWWAIAEAEGELPADADRDEYLFCLQDAWAKVKTPLGANVIQTAIERISQTQRPEECLRFGSEKIKTLIHFCHELQALNGDRPFFISARDAGKVIGCSWGTAATFINGLVRAKVLLLVTKGVGHHASRFRYNKTIKPLPQLKVISPQDDGEFPTPAFE